VGGDGVGRGVPLRPASTMQSYYGVLMGAGALLGTAVAIVFILVVCRRRGSNRRRDEAEQKERVRLREAVRASQVPAPNKHAKRT